MPPDEKMTPPGNPVRSRSPERRSQEVRRLEANEAIISTAIECLDQYGYGATTTLLVSSRARVTRGALLHYYPSKAALIVAVAEHVGRWQHGAHGDELRKLRGGRARLLALVDIMWRLALEPESHALLEIRNGVRRDPELQSLIVPILEANIQRHRDAVLRMAQDAGLKDPQAMEPMAELLMATIQGLAVRCKTSMGAFDPTCTVKILDARWRAAVTSMMAAGT